ncbi:Spc24 subunit of Ndc80-like protein [Elsinoe fawcettii]|nr:Spc24 subunit of Ndc80-like protein [Elsinoe fawcettii]
MVLFDEDPVTLIRQTTLNFHTHSDLSCLSRIGTSLSTLRSARSLRLDTQKSKLATLSRQLRSAEQTHSDALEHHDASGHAQEVLRLDTEKFRVAKGVSEVRGECERREGEVRGLRRVVEGFDAVGKREEDGEEDETVLRLRVYRGLGVDVEPDAEGEFRRAVVRSGVKGDVRVINIEEGVGRGFYVGHIWGCL